LVASAVPTAAGEILIVADETTRKLVNHHLGMLGIGVAHASSQERALYVATEKAALLDSILIDAGVAGLDLWSLLAQLKADPDVATVPIVVILGRPPSEADAVRLIEAGVHDHLTKPFGGTLLCAKLRATSERARSQRELKNKLRVALEYSAHDALTGLFNRRYFERRLREESAHARRHRRPFAIIIVDLDHFKVINDTCGHEHGDRVLCHVAEQITKSLREDDVACRYGGEEFVVLLRGTEGTAARVVANRVRASVASSGLKLGPKQETRIVTLSGGVAAADDRNDYNVEGIVDRADKALYRAKAAGRNRVEVE
jgi:two-component system, cell cycle response regulator